MHLILSVPVFLSDKEIQVKSEIQIRTVAMDFWASLEHKIYYKYSGETPPLIKEELKDCANIVSHLDNRMLVLHQEIKDYKKDKPTGEDQLVPIITAKRKIFI